ncbi:hypothetical protein T09_6278, partial [Trichinella sp. T9]
LEIKKIVPLCLIATRDSLLPQLSCKSCIHVSGNADEVDTVLNDRQVITER